MPAQLCSGPKRDCKCTAAWRLGWPTACCKQGQGRARVGGAKGEGTCKKSLGPQAAREEGHSRRGGPGPQAMHEKSLGRRGAKKWPAVSGQHCW